MLRIVTDSASDITLKDAQAMKIDLVFLEITFPDGSCPQKKEADFQTFYKRLEASESLPITSRPSPQAYLDVFQEAKAQGDEVLVLCLSSGLSSTIESAQIAREMVEYEKIQIVDTHQAILAQRMLVEYAVKLRNDGKGSVEIAQEIERIRDDVVVCGVVDTLTYLKKGGRIPASLALIGEFLKIKPVIVLQDKILKTIGKARGHRAGVEMLYKHMEADGFDKDYPLYFGYTSNRDRGTEFMLNTMDRYKLDQVQIQPVGGVIGTHCGTNCIAVAYVRKGTALKNVSARGD